jgi:hypothetical protein
MVKTFLVREKMDLQGVSGQLLDSRFRGERADAALGELRRLNPHADLAALKPGTVLLVPDTPGFKATAGASPTAAAFSDFRKLAVAALDEASTGAKSGREARSADRARLTETLKGAAFQRLIAGDETLRQQADEAAKSLTNAENEDGKADAAFATAVKSVITALDELGKGIG